MSCYNTSIDEVCAIALAFCNDRILQPLAGEWDASILFASVCNSVLIRRLIYFSSIMFQPKIHVNSIASAIGAETTWQQFNLAVYVTIIPH